MKNKLLFVVIVMALVIAAAGMLWFHFGSSANSSASHGSPVVCTTEAKICPDGSAVGRTGPQCEFAPCPAVSIPRGWMTTTTRDVTFSYPPAVDSEYVRPTAWPPQVTITNGAYSCDQYQATTSESQIIRETIIHGHQYCIAKMGEGAAGSTYTTYTFTTARNQQLLTLSATIQTPQCLNYDEPKRTDCQREQAAFDLGQIITDIVTTIKL